MKRTMAIICAAMGAAALFGGLVYAVLAAAHVSDPAAATVSGLTLRRLWATTAAVLALAGVVGGGLALARPASGFGAASGRPGMIAGLIAALNGGLNVAVATGGPGSGNGVVGGAAAFVLGLIAVGLNWLALARRRPTAWSGGE